MANAKFYGTGRRKKSIARVYLVPGTGKITINWFLNQRPKNERKKEVRLKGSSSCSTVQQEIISLLQNRQFQTVFATLSGLRSWEGFLGSLSVL